MIVVRLHFGYSEKTSQEIFLLFNRTDFVKRDSSTILINKVERGGEVCPPALNFLEYYALIFQYFGFKL